MHLFVTGIEAVDDHLELGGTIEEVDRRGQHQGVCLLHSVPHLLHVVLDHTFAIALVMTVFAGQAGSNLHLADVESNGFVANGRDTRCQRIAELVAVAADARTGR